MQNSARYLKLDLVDYFKKLTQVPEELIRRFEGNPSCLAVLGAFSNSEVILGRAALSVQEQLHLHPSKCLDLLKQATRRHDLPTNDERYIGINDEALAERERL